ncbi:MAG: thermonuclease family protein [Planctomycetes bacterium]|nr:thermonuclease family protein [Planctomycetota bacterium]
MRRFTTALLAAATAVLVLAGPTLAQTAPVTVVRVIAGDTTDVQFEDGTVVRVRLIGIDTPESVDPRTVVQCYALEAAARARELLEGQVVTLELDPGQGERDRYGRLLAYLYLPDGQNVAEVLIGEGYAFEYTDRFPYAYQAPFQAAEQGAMTNGLGLWAAETCGGQRVPSDLDEPTVPGLEPRPGPLEAAPPAAAPVARYDPFGPDRDCGDFATWQQAQDFYRAAGGPATDRHRLDADRDGMACESLPGAP